MDRPNQAIAADGCTAAERQEPLAVDHLHQIYSDPIMPDQDLASELARAKEDMGILCRRIKLLEQKLDAIPDTL